MLSQNSRLTLLLYSLQSVSTIQAAFRGHAARERLLRTRRVATLSDDDVDNMSETSSLYEEDVTLMQAAFRGHLSRRNLLDRKNRFEDYDSDYDDTNQPLRPRRFVLRIITILQTSLGTLSFSEKNWNNTESFCKV